jgi:hypothetical protein
MQGRRANQRGVHRKEDAGREHQSAKSGRRSLVDGGVSRPHFLGIAAASLLLMNLTLLLISPAWGGVGKGNIKDMGGAPGSEMRDWASLVKHPYGHGPYTRCPLAPLQFLSLSLSLSLESPRNISFHRAATAT